MAAIDWIQQLLPHGSVAGGLSTLSLAITVGLIAGSVRILGVRLGLAAVLFSGLLFGQLGFTIDEQILQFLRDFALILFIYTVGLEVGPSFLDSFRSEGLKLNLLAAAVVILGSLTTAIVVFSGALSHQQAAGLYSGSFSTAPGLAAAQEAMRTIATAKAMNFKTANEALGLAYAVAFPFGLFGPILLVIFFRFLFRIDLQKEMTALNDAQLSKRPPTATIDVDVTNPAIAGTKLIDHDFLEKKGVLFTRLLRDGQLLPPSGETEFRIGDTLRAVGPTPAVDEIIKLLGRKSDLDLTQASGDVQRMTLVVTQRRVLGRTLRELDLIKRACATVAFVVRAGVELTPRANLQLQFGDTVTVVGPSAGLKLVEAELGNATEAINRTPLVPLFLGIWLGVIVGSIPLALPGLGTPLKIGLAGGPMIVAIVLARLGRIGPAIWYMPVAANQALREFGIAVFLACVGFQSGDHFVQKLLTGQGAALLAWGAVVTTVPMLLVGIFARLVLKMNFITLSGLIAGSMTSSPTLYFVNDTNGTTAGAVAYAAVYPIATILPVFCSQLLVTLLLR